MNEKYRRSWMKHLDFIILDIIALSIAFWSAFYVRSNMISTDVMEFLSGIPYRSYYLIFLGIFILFAFFSRNYSNIIRRSYIEEFGAVLQIEMLLLAGILGYLVFTKQSSLFSRLLLGYILVFDFILMIIFRFAWKKIIRKKIFRTDNLSRMIVISEESQIKECLCGLQTLNYQPFGVDGIILLDRKYEENTYINNIPVVADADGMMEYIRLNVVDQVIIQVGDSLNQAQMLARKLLEMGIVVHISMEQALGNLPNKQLEKVGSLNVITTSFQVAGNLELLFKRLMDICGSVVGLMITAVAFVFVAPILYIKSPGPIFFSQYRMGKNGRKFKIYKFRSMYMDAEERKKELMEKNKMQGFMFKMDNDPRIIKGIGKFIRDTSIDELPQFWNILKGDMSLVGTRPPTLDEFEQYQMHHKIRLSFRPGLTGLWQVSGRSDITDFEEVVRLDEEYIANWSIWLDIKIILQTVYVVLKRKGSE